MSIPVELVRCFNSFGIKVLVPGRSADDRGMDQLADRRKEDGRADLQRLRRTRVRLRGPLRPLWSARPDRPAPIRWAFSHPAFSAGMRSSRSSAARRPAGTDFLPAAAVAHSTCKDRSTGASSRRIAPDQVCAACRRRACAASEIHTEAGGANEEIRTQRSHPIARRDDRRHQLRPHEAIARYLTARP